MESEDPIRLGAFDLLEVIGTGGMAEVWRGRHRRQGIPAAVKFVQPQGFGTESYRRFRDEVRSHARLTYSGIVQIFDYGRVGASVADASGGRLVEGRPYLCMELADRGTLRDVMPLEDWMAVRSVLLHVIYALGYSHACDVIHRDLKPENILCISGEPDVRYALSDFGIAHAFEDRENVDSDESTIPDAGTPQYMAPEQVRGKWRRFGPWSDLYSLGIIAWELVSGRLPFSGDTAFDTAVKHLNEDLPALEPRFPVPPDFEDWIARMTAKQPEARFQRAADAAWALATLRDQPESSTTRSTGEEPIDASATTKAISRGTGVIADGLTDTMVMEETIELAREDRRQTTEDVKETSGPQRIVPEPPPLPGHWKQAVSRDVSVPAGDVGLGLFGLRNVPFVDRTTERDALWDALEAVVEKGETRVVVIAGASGLGKSRLVHWISRRGREFGATTTLKAVHHPTSGPADGLRGMLDDYFRTWRAEGETTYSVIREILGAVTIPGALDAEAPFDEFAERLTEFLRPGPEGRATSKEESFELLNSLLCSLDARRPLLIWLDDIQWGPYALQWLKWTLQRPDPPVALFGITARNDAAGERAKSIVEETVSLDADERVETLEIDRMDSDDYHELVGRLLALESELVDVVARSTEGNPLLALHLVQDWVDRDLLEPSDEGFRLGGAVEDALPADAHDLWMRRFDHTLEPLSGERREEVLQALEVAAAFGRSIRDVEWRAACEELGLESPEDIVKGVLVERGLTEIDEAGFRFAHQMIVDSLCRRSREGGRYEDHHRACAQAVAETESGRPESLAIRSARHWAESGTDASIAHLALAARAAATSSWDEWASHLDETRRCLEEEAERTDDHARLAERAGDLALESGVETAADVMYALAARLWGELQKPDKAESARRKRS